MGGNAGRLLIVGGSGFIGHHLVSTAHSKGYQVSSLGLKIPSDDRYIKGVDYLTANLTSNSEVEHCLSGQQFEYVVNLGGYINHASYRSGGRSIIDAHFIGLQNLLQTIDWKSLKTFVQIGSSDEYGNQAAPQSEEMREQPISPYSMAKVAANHLLQTLYRTEGFPAVMLRFFLVYGPGQDRQRFLPQIIKGCLLDETFPTSMGEQLRDFCHVKDVVGAIMAALDNEKAYGEIINVASGEPVAIKSMIEKVRKGIQAGQPQFGKVPYREKENMALYADISKAVRFLSWEPQISLDQGLNNTIEYYREFYKS